MLQAKFSTIDLAFCKSYMRIEEDFTEDDQLIQLYLQSAKAFIMDYTEMDSEQLDEFPFVCIVVLKLVADFYSNKSVYVQNKNSIDPVVESLLSKVRNYNV